MIAFLLTQPRPKTAKSVVVIGTIEQQLIYGLRDGDPGSFNKLYRDYSANLFGVIHKIINQQETAEDLLQEVFIKIRRNFKSYDEHRSRLFTWMLNIARNTAIDHLRLKSSRQDKAAILIEDAGALLDGYSSAINTDTLGIKNLINELPSRQRVILELCYYKGYTHAEIAEALNMPLGSVKTTLRQAILTLRGIFDIFKPQVIDMV